jgi:nitrite reductase/ring-hydroxylating ferredoxin subunit/DMSO/TMAO reductase YedYZ heme-binding membrane subunit
MTVPYKPVNWNRNKIIYDGVLATGVAVYLFVYFDIGPRFQSVTRAYDDNTLAIDAYGSCAFLMLTLILCIGPLSRLDPRFLPILYNRRHFGVMTCGIALLHARAVLDWYFAYSPIPQAEAVFLANTSYGQLLGFPFEIFGMFALLVLLVLATTSHDFWLHFLTPPAWKAIHMVVYFAYAAIVIHLALGSFQTLTNPTFPILAFAGVTTVGTLHVLAARAGDKIAKLAPADWMPAASLDDLVETCGVIVNFAEGERAAIFLHGGKLSALANACAHQNGPLGEGRIVDGLVTCPWHGFQYDPSNGCAPAPFTEKVATYRLKLEGRQILIDPRPNPAGTYVEPLTVPGDVT